MKFIKLATLVFLAFLIFQNCSQPGGPQVCTTEFVMLSVTVLEPNNTPADSVEISVTNTETGNKYECGEYLCRETQNGTYTIMHDGLREIFNDNEITTVVEGVKDSLQFNEEFIFRRGGCHVQKLAGPDTVSLSSKN